MRTVEIDRFLEESVLNYLNGENKVKFIEFSSKWMINFQPDEIKMKDILNYARISNPDNETRENDLHNEILNLVISEFQIIENNRRHSLSEVLRTLLKK
jgi:hypothetical protein